jgi:tripartite-type tricarboxylate transporter receptor subunit TctC
MEIAEAMKMRVSVTTIVRVCTVACVLHAGAASAQAYPARPIRWVAPFPPGGTTDIVARIVAEKLTESLGQQVTLDNRPGAGGNIAAEIVVKAPPDGYTLLTGFPGLAINPGLYAKMSYEPLRDLAPIILISSAPLLMVVHPALPAKTVKELIALAKRRPGELSFPSAGNGSSSHLGGELFKSSAGIDIQHVPYKGSMQGMVDLISGRMQLMVNPLPEMIQFVESGKLRAIAVTGLKRSPVMPELPTVAETLPGFEVTTWNGLMAPAATPKEIVARLNAEVVKLLKAPATMKRMTELGLDTIASTPEQFADHLRRETDKWAKVVKAAGVRIE